MKIIWPKNKKIQYLAGIDEVGRGPLAGPVTMGIVIIKKDSLLKFKSFLKTIDLKDSKQLSHKKREEIFNLLKKEKYIKWKVISKSSALIDAHGISKCIKNIIKELLKNNKDNDTYVRLDGSLKAPSEFLFQETIIKGDEKDPLIALASIVAKETRDTYMMKISSKYPQYGFERHKGYGTKLHRTALRKYGLADIHRKSYCKSI